MRLHCLERSAAVTTDVVHSEDLMEKNIYICIKYKNEIHLMLLQLHTPAGCMNGPSTKLSCTVGQYGWSSSTSADVPVRLGEPSTLSL